MGLNYINQIFNEFKTIKTKSLMGLKLKIRL
jgi:hypothetical protein